MQETPKEPFIKIEYANQIKAKELAKYIKSLDNEFANFVKESKMDKLFSGELSITKINEGSIELFCSPEYLIGVIPLFTNANVIFDFLNHMKNYFSMIKEGKTKDIPTVQIKNYEGMAGLTVNGDTKVNYIDNRGGNFLLVDSLRALKPN